MPHCTTSIFHSFCGGTVLEEHDQKHRLDIQGSGLWPRTQVGDSAGIWPRRKIGIWPRKMQGSGTRPSTQTAHRTGIWPKRQTGHAGVRNITEKTPTHPPKKQTVVGRFHTALFCAPEQTHWALVACDRMSDCNFLLRVWIFTKVVYLQHCFGCYMAGATWNCYSLGTFCLHHTQRVTPLHANHMRRVPACLAVTCEVHLWQNDQDCLRASVVTWGWTTKQQSQGHHTIDRLEERGVKRGSAWWSSLKLQKGHHQSDQYWHCFKDNMVKTPERQGGAHIGFPQHIDIIMNWTKLKKSTREAQLCRNSIPVQLNILKFFRMATLTRNTQNKLWVQSEIVTSDDVFI